MSKDIQDPDERYLAEVDAALAARDVDDRADIVAGLRDHIVDAMADGRNLDEVLRELGDPQLIAASAGIERTDQGVRSKAWFSVVALAMLSVGALLLIFLVPVVLVVAGLVLLWLSKLWTVREKLWGTLLVPAPGLAIGIILGAVSISEVCTTSSDGRDTQTVCRADEGGTSGVIVTFVLIAIALIGVAVTIKLARKALARR